LLVFLTSPVAQSENDATPVDPGDLIYFPDMFWHATINLDPYTVFVSTFTTEHGAEDSLDEL
jgi:ribosomal protein L16 Arg81 hydroxylase